MKNTYPLISIVIPLYNKGKFVKRGLDSVQKQSYTNWEVIIVDDGSTDNSFDYVKPYLLDKRFKYFYKDNGGVSSARNYGVEKANGEYIVFLDADDYFINTCLENLNDTRLRYSTMAVVSNFATEDRIKGILRPSSVKLFPGVLRNNFRSWFVDGVIPRTGAAMFHKSILQRFPYKEYLSRFEDAEELFNIMRETVFAYTPHIAMVYTQDVKGLSIKLDAEKDFTTHIDFKNKSFWERILLAQIIQLGITSYPSLKLKKKYEEWMKYITYYKIINVFIRLRKKIITRILVFSKYR